MVVKLVKRLEEILLENSKPNRTTRINTLTNLMVCQALTTFLKENQNVFTFSHEDMSGIDPSVMVHKLNVLPSFPLVC